MRRPAMAGKENVRELKFEGKLDIYDIWTYPTTGPNIGGRDVIDEIEAIWRESHTELTVYLGTQGTENREKLAEGRSDIYHGFCGSEVTPADPAEIRVGGIDLLAKLREHDDEFVVLIIEGPLAGR
jgi:hypothetical protein